MDKVAALTDRERSQLFEETAARRSIHPAVTEKDFWVCWALKKLFGCNDLAGHLVFKGETPGLEYSAGSIQQGVQ